MLAEEAIGLLPVHQLIIVRAADPVLSVPAERNPVFHKRIEEGLDLFVDVRLDQGSAKAAVIFCIVDQERGPRRAHGNQQRVILALGEIGCVLLNFVGIARMREVGLKRAEAGYLNAHCDARVCRAEQYGLPPAA